MKTGLGARGWGLVAALALAIASPAFAQTKSRTPDVNRRDVDGTTPLQWAVYKGDVVEVRRLLRAGIRR